MLVEDRKKEGFLTGIIVVVVGIQPCPVNAHVGRAYHP